MRSMVEGLLPESALKKPLHRPSDGPPALEIEGRKI
jgi:hypothetical protein